MVGSRQEAIQMYMESGFDAPMMDWLADNGMSEIVFRRMQIESNKQILALLQDIKELLVSIDRESPPRP
jgi:type IV secretory pathway VirJ component